MARHPVLELQCQLYSMGMNRDTVLYSHDSLVHSRNSSLPCSCAPSPFGSDAASSPFLDQHEHATDILSQSDAVLSATPRLPARSASPLVNRRPEQRHPKRHTHMRFTAASLCNIHACTRSLCHPFVCARVKRLAFSWWPPHRLSKVVGSRYFQSSFAAALTSVRHAGRHLSLLRRTAAQT